MVFYQILFTGLVLINLSAAEYGKVSLRLSAYSKLDGQIKDTLAEYAQMESLTQRIYPLLHDLTRVEFFRYFRLDLQKECPFWPNANICSQRDCTVRTLPEESKSHQHIRESWEDEHLGDLETSSYQPTSPFGVKCDSNEDFCVQEDAKATSNMVYVDLLQNPERFTGYSGDSSWKVWKAIYEQNCFKFVFGEQKKLSDALVPQDDVCLERRAFYKVISGLHSSISVHLCEGWLNKTTNEWVPNLDCYHSRVGNNPERIQNLFFLHALITQAVSQLGEYLDKYTFCTGNKMEDLRTRTLLKDIYAVTREQQPYFQVDQMFNGNAQLKEDFRLHFMNVSRIMDCVGCEKCRLWGKIQVNGIGAAMKILFTNPDSKPVLRRSELVALMNAYTRFTESIKALDTFRRLHAARLREYENNERSFVYQIADQVVEALRDPNIVINFFKKIFLPQ
jgi:hypothetical protein